MKKKLVFSLQRLFSCIIENVLVYGFDLEGLAHVELPSSVSGAKLITGINVVRRR